MKAVEKIIAILLLCLMCVSVSACAREGNERPKKTARFTTPDGEVVELVIKDWILSNSGLIKLFLEDGSWIVVGSQNVMVTKEASR